jgi:hypothetical protein
VNWPHKEDLQRRMQQTEKRSLSGSHFPRKQIEVLTSKMMDPDRDDGAHVTR